MSRHFPIALACYGGDRRRDRDQTATLALGRLSRPLLLGRLFPTFLHSGTYLLGGFVRCRLFSERHTLQTIKPGGFNQWLPTTTQNPQEELRIGTVKATVWENDVGGITHHNVAFSRIYPEGGQWKTTQSFRFVNLLSVAKLADQAHTLIAERKAEAGDDNTEAA